MRNNRVHDNAVNRAAIYLGVSGDTGSTVTNNTVWNDYDGIDIQSSGTTTVVENNRISSSSRYGIYIVSAGVARNNVVSSSGDFGIRLDNGTLAENNTVFSNRHGILASHSGSGIIRNNRVFNNTEWGIAGYHDALIEGNTVFGNQYGIGAWNFNLFTGDIVNNVIYANTTHGIWFDRGGAGALVKNNSIYQPLGVGIELTNSSSNVELRNNIIEVQSGAAIVVPTNSQVGFKSNYNLIYTPGAGTLGNWGGVATTAGPTGSTSWASMPRAWSGDTAAFAPQWVDFNGADNILGYVPTPVILDDGDAGYSTVGTWTTVTGSGGVGGDYQQNTATSGTKKASWTFTVVAGAAYDLAATWRALGSNTSNAVYQILDGANPDRHDRQGSTRRTRRLHGIRHWLGAAGQHRRHGHDDHGGSHHDAHTDPDGGCHSAGADRRRHGRQLPPGRELPGHRRRLARGRVRQRAGPQRRPDQHRLRRQHGPGHHQPGRARAAHYAQRPGEVRERPADARSNGTRTAPTRSRPTRPTSSPPANQLPVSYWRFGETSGTTAADSAGTRTGTYVGNPTLGVQGAFGARTQHRRQLRWRRRLHRGPRRRQPQLAAQHVVLDVVQCRHVHQPVDAAAHQGSGQRATQPHVQPVAQLGRLPADVDLREHDRADYPDGDRLDPDSASGTTWPARSTATRA